MAEALIAGAGTADANGVYTENGTRNSKALFDKDAGLWDVSWSGIRWEIRQATSVMYNATAFTGTTYPWEATGWAAVFGDAPAPTVTENSVTAPTVTTQAVTSIGTTTATGNGNVTSDGGATITERGVCWNTSTNPTTANSKATSAGTTGAYTASMTSLSPSTFYYVRAYAINSVGTSYGSNETFTTNAAGIVTKPVPVYPQILTQ